MASEIVYKTDRFGGVLVDVADQTFINVDDFVRKMKETVVGWKSEGKRGLWVTLQTAHSGLVPYLTELGFDFHHAGPGSVCLTKWLPENIPNHIPGYANHYLGVGGFVVDADKQILVIREKYHVQNNISTWKLPGGLAEAGEDLSETARREVLEETGVETEFVCVLAFRHMHNYRHGCSDFYHVCLMKPLTREIKPCPMEIAECRWMNLNEYEKMEGISDVNKHLVGEYRKFLSTGHAIGVEQVLSFDRKSLQNVYSVQKFQHVNVHLQD